jgi:phosphatidylglycerophosphate synthase
MSDRRPIASRERDLSKRVAQLLVSSGVSPNVISLVGMFAGILAGLALAVTAIPGFGHVYFIVAALLMQLRLLANMLDGMVAVETSKASPVGELFNEIPDRVADTAIFVGAGYASGGEPVLGYIAACLAIFIAYVRVEGKVAGAKMEYCGPMAKPQRVFALTLIAVYVGLAPASWQPALTAMPEWGAVAFGLGLIIVGELSTVIRRLSRIVNLLKGT